MLQNIDIMYQDIKKSQNNTIPSEQIKVAFWHQKYSLTATNKDVSGSVYRIVIIFLVSANALHCISMSNLLVGQDKIFDFYRDGLFP